MSAARVLEFAAVQEPVTCSQCGVVFSIPQHLEQSKRRDHSNFFCPNGHSQHYPYKTEAEKEREARIAAERERDAARELSKKLAKQLSEVHERVSKGVCPCCKRSFANVRRHMASKHPGFGGAS